MNSARCSKCSLVNFTSSEVCKRCGEPLDSAVSEEPFAPPPDVAFGTHSTQNSYGTPSEAIGDTAQYQPRFEGTRSHSHSAKGKSVGLTLLALVCLVALVGIPLYLKSRGPNEFASLSWREYKPDDGSFSVLMPGEPQKNSMSLPTPKGNIQVNMYHVETAGQTAFAVGSIEYPTVSSTVPVEMLFDKAMESLATRSQMIVLSRKNIMLDGHPGIEAEIKPPASAKKDGDKGMLRLYWVSPRIYMVMVGGPDSSEAAAARIKFLDSFKMNK